MYMEYEEIGRRIAGKRKRLRMTSNELLLGAVSLARNFLDCLEDQKL